MYLKIIVIVLVHVCSFSLSIDNREKLYSMYAVAGPDNCDMTQVCGGTLISLAWYMTSAKCLTALFQKSRQITIAAGFKLRQGFHMVSRPASHYVHESSQEMADVGLIRVDPPFIQSDYLHVADLPHSETDFCGKPMTGVISRDPATSSRQWKKTMEAYRQVFGRRYLTMNGSKAHWFTSPMAKRVTKTVKEGGSRSDQRQVKFINSTFANRPPSLCENQQGGWPLFCEQTVVGIENGCSRSGMRSSEATAEYVDVVLNLDFIASAMAEDKITKMTKKDMKPEGKKSDSGGCAGNMVLILVLVLFLVM